MEIAICDPDPELTALMSGGLLLRKNFGSYASPDNKSIGWAAPAVGDDPAGNGVAVEVWSFAVKDGKRASSLPYFYWVFPYVKLRQSGDRVIENGLLANTFEGYGLGNIEFDSGLDGRWEFPVATERPYAYSRASWAPQGLKGFYRWFADSTKTVNNKSKLQTLQHLQQVLHTDMKLVRALLYLEWTALSTVLSQSQLFQQLQPSAMQRLQQMLHLQQLAQ
jgi:hypothetical protein